MARDKAGDDRRGVQLTKGSAKELSEVLRAARGGDRGQFPVGFQRDTAHGASYTWAWALNTTSGTVPKYGNLRLDRLVNSSTILESAGAGVWNGMMPMDDANSTPTPVFVGVFPWVHPNFLLVNSSGTYLTYGIALHDIPANTIGRVAVSGIVAARVKDGPDATPGTYPDPTTDDVRIAGPCVTGGSTVSQLEAGWGPHEVVSPGYPADAVDLFPLYLVRVNARPFRIYAKGSSDDIGSGGISAGGNGALVVQFGGYGAQRDAVYGGTYRIKVQVKSPYMAVPPGKTCIVEPGAGGTFVVVNVAP